ncbi:MAG: putative ABC exporter domain-containing protein [Candidatus Dormibacteria bacterium]
MRSFGDGWRSLAGLAWLDWRVSVNRVGVILQNPRRLILYVIIGGLFVASQLNSVAHAGRRSVFGPLLRQYGEPAALVLPGLGLLLAGITVLRAHGRPGATFASPADGHFLIGAAVSPRVLMAWLLLRAVRRMVLTLVWVAALSVLVYAPLMGVSTAAALTATLAVIAYFAVAFSLQPACFFISRRVGFTLSTGVGYLLLAGAGVMLSLTALRLSDVRIFPPFLSDFLNALPPGAWLVTGMRGDLSGVLALVLLALLLFGVATMLADDCYPELWAASTRAFIYRRAAREGGGGWAAIFRARRALREHDGGGGEADREVVSSNGRSAPEGPWIIAWKEWRVTRHSAGGGARSLVAVVVAPVVGAGFGILARGPGSTIAVSMAIGLFVFFMVASGLGTVEMTADLRNPLWWLSGSPLVQRLAIWTGTRTLKSTAHISLVVAAFALVGPGTATFAIPAAALVLLTGWLFQLVGLVAYTLLPATSDARLNQLVRLGLIYAVLIVISVPAAVVGLASHSGLAGAIVALVLGLGLMVGGLFVAADRVTGNGQTLVRERGL